MLQQHVPGAPLSPDPNLVLQCAQHYSQLGFVPLATYVAIGRTQDGRPICSCYRAGDCKNAGKHPIGLYADIDTPDKGYAQVAHAVRSEASQGRPVNLAIRAGTMSGIFVVDLDIKEGKNGVEQFQRWLNAKQLSYETLNKTLMARSGGGGIHLVFKHPKGVELSPKNGTEEFGDGVDIKAAGTPFHVYPSIHKYGGEYQWTNWVEPLDAPDPIWRVVQKKQTQSFNIDESYTPSKSEIREYADLLMRSKKELQREVGKNIKDAIDGQVIAKEGGGHDAFRDIAFFLLKQWPTSNVEALCRFLEPAIQARIDFMPDSGTSFDDVLNSFITAQGKLEEHRSSWSGQVAVNEQGKPVVCDANMLLFFRNHPAWKGVFGYNTRRNRAVYMRKPPLTREVPLGDIELSRDKSEVALWFQNKGQMVGKFSSKDMLDALNAAAWDFPFDPLRDLVLQLRGTWDGVRRLEYVLQRVAGVEDTPWVRTVFPLWMKSLVMRIVAPGCKVDTMLVLEGDTGFRKSTFFEAILPDPQYFSDSLKKVSHDTESLRLIHSGPAIFEIGELSGLRKSEVEDIKAFLSARKDDIRPLFENYRNVERRCVFVGTTNRNDYLRDETGGRRFWPVTVRQRIDIETVARERMQWFAEALARLDMGEVWWLAQNEELLAAAEQEGRLEEDIWKERIIQWLSARAPQEGDKEKPTEHTNGFLYANGHAQHGVVYPNAINNGAPPAINKGPTSQMQAEINKQMAGDTVTVGQVAQYALQIELKNARSLEGLRITKILTILKWRPVRVYVDGTRIRAWSRPLKTDYSNQINAGVP